MAGRGSRARTCSARCRQRVHRYGRPAEDGLRVAPHEGVPPLSGLVDAVVRELAAARRLETVAGQQALALAVRLSTPSLDTASSLATAHRELRVLMAEALDGAQGSPTLLDELRQRRDRKRGAARRRGGL